MAAKKSPKFKKNTKKKGSIIIEGKRDGIAVGISAELYISYRKMKLIGATVVTAVTAILPVLYYYV